MKKIKRIGYIVLIVIVVVLSLTIYTNASKDNGETQKEKTFSEIKYMETTIANLFNSMNHIESSNYSIVTSELSEESTEKSESSNSSSTSESGGNSSSGGNNSSNGQSSSNSSNQGTTSEDEQDKKKFELQSNGVLTNTNDIDWKSVKSEIENLYTSLPSITLDLYQSNVNQEDVLGFNTEYDKLTSIAKDEKKEETLAELTKVYEYLPKFLMSSGQEELYTTLVETKYYVFKGYSKLDGQNWQEISNDVKNAIDTYSKLLTNTEIEVQKQYSVSKGYIMLNELQNASNLKEPAVFLIKYKNLLEEFNNI